MRYQVLTVALVLKVKVEQVLNMTADEFAEWVMFIGMEREREARAHTSG